MAASDLNPAPGERRARALGITFDGMPGSNNAISDVPGVAVGYVTLVRGDGRLRVGQGPVRTGVTAIIPRPFEQLLRPVFAGIHSLNGIGELSGAHQIVEVGRFVGPLTLTNTHSCGVARDATLEWMNFSFQGAFDDGFGLPVAAETYDGFLNDINGFHVKREHVFEAIESAIGGAIEEGSVGGGTGMKSFDFKAGSGTASRLITDGDKQYALGVFVQANFGERRDLLIQGRRIGALLEEPAMQVNTPVMEKSSIIGVIATDAPMLPHQLARLAKRAPLGMARTGGFARHYSGDLFLAFSTANIDAMGDNDLVTAQFIPDPMLDPYFEAVVQSTEEAILNSIVCNREMVGRDGNTVPALPLRTVQKLMGDVG